MEGAGEGVWIEAPFYCDYGKHIHIGDNTFVNMNCIFLDDHYIKIGSDGLIGPYTQIYTAGHPLRAADRIQKEEGHSREITTQASGLFANKCHSPKMNIVSYEKTTSGPPWW